MSSEPKDPVRERMVAEQESEAVERFARMRERAQVEFDAMSPEEQERVWPSEKPERLAEEGTLGTWIDKAAKELPAQQEAVNRLAEEGRKATTLGYEIPLCCARAESPSGVALLCHQPMGHDQRSSSAHTCDGYFWNGQDRIATSWPRDNLSENACAHSGCHGLTVCRIVAAKTSLGDAAVDAMLYGSGAVMVTKDGVERIIPAPSTPSTNQDTSSLTKTGTTSMSDLERETTIANLFIRLNLLQQEMAQVIEDIDYLRRKD